MSSSSPSLSKSRWTRMGGAVRRASSILVPSRPSSPSIAPSERDTDATSMKGSVKDIATTEVIPTAVSPHTQPSPIPESPARELQASQEEPINIDPSPLGQAPITASPVQEYTPPPLIDSTASGPGGFSDELDELPQSETIKDPALTRKDPADEHESQTKSIHDPSMPPVAATDIPTLPSTPETAAAHPLPETSMPEHAAPPSEHENSGSYFELPVRADSHDVSEPMPLGFNDEDALGQDSTRASVPERQDIAELRDHEVRNDERNTPVDSFPEESLRVSEISTVEPQNPSEATAAAPGMLSYDAPHFDYRSTEEVWGDVLSKAAQELGPPTSEDANMDHNMGMPMEDPFIDPVAPRILVSQPEPPLLPNPHTIDEQQQKSSQSHEEVQSVVMPLPQMNETTQTKLPAQSVGDLDPHDPSQNEHSNADETSPLLSRQGSLKYSSYLQPSTAPRDVVNVSPRSGVQSLTPWPVHSSIYTSRLRDLGWIEYRLPDGVLYYVHPTKRITADIDLNVDAKLDAITAYLESQKDASGAPAGMELWLRENKSTYSKHGFRPARLWINHKQRLAIHDRPPINGSAGRSRKVSEDDNLDAEYRYWSFVESHPIHTTLPPSAKNEATEVLTWAWTDRLLPSHPAVPAPFTPEECQELTALLRSFEQGDTGFQTAVHTRIVSRILLRVAHWRQRHFRPNKPLPNDVGPRNAGLPKHHRPLRRAFFDLIISCLCLGIPYIFFERSRHYRIDEESGHRSPGPMFMIGACTCLVAAVILSASVTFLSLPGLDNFARVAGFVAILFATFSMGSTLVAVFRYKADLEITVSHVAGEGLTMLSRRSVIFSLPLVFLVYSIVAFATGIVLYSFGGFIDDPLKPRRHFEDYTKWTVVGVLGGLAGMLITSLSLLRR